MTKVPSLSEVTSVFPRCRVRSVSGVKKGRSCDVEPSLCIQPSNDYYDVHSSSYGLGQITVSENEAT